MRKVYFYIYPTVLPSTNIHLVSSMDISNNKQNGFETKSNAL